MTGTVFFAISQSVSLRSLLGGRLVIKGKGGGLVERRAKSPLVYIKRREGHFSHKTIFSVQDKNTAISSVKAEFMSIEKT